MEQQLEEDILKSSTKFKELKEEIGRHLVGNELQQDLVLIGLLANGHVLLESVPGLAKTLLVKLLANALDLDFKRIQFTPDLLPADLIGTEIYNPKSHLFETIKGPVFTNLLLADEINRAPAKLQSALLEAMEEKQVSIGNETFKLDDPFIVLATQNPVDQEGTYLLPEAQVDRFMMKVKIDYPGRSQESEIIRRMAHPEKSMTIKQVLCKEDIFEARKLVDKIYMDKKIEDFILDIVFSTRLMFDHLSERQDKQSLVFLENLIERGASPRASLNMILACKAHALLKQRAYVNLEDVKAISNPVLCHRIHLSYEAEAEGLNEEEIIDEIFKTLKSP